MVSSVVVIVLCDVMSTPLRWAAAHRADTPHEPRNVPENACTTEHAAPEALSPPPEECRSLSWFHGVA